LLEVGQNTQEKNMGRNVKKAFNPACIGTECNELSLNHYAPIRKVSPPI
jgi:hypothetical protein